MLRKIEDTSEDRRFISALHRIRGNHDWTIIREFLENERGRIGRDNETQRDEVVFRQQQGACQALGDLFQKQDRAVDTIKKMEE